MTSKTEELVGITDKQLIIYLICRQFKIQDIKIHPEGRKSVLFFNNTKELKKAMIDYTNKIGEINIANYLAVEKRVKNLLYFNKELQNIH